jgi:hypothetical protein
MNKETPERAPLSSAYRNSAAVLPWMLCAATLIASEPARAGGALPTNGQYVAGQGSIASSAGNVTVNQSSSHGIINWQGFSIAQGNSVLAYATGSVAAPLAINVGGLLGWNSGAVKNVYVAGNVSGKAGSTGALVGDNIATGSIANAYIDAAITGSLSAAGTNLGTLQVTAVGGADEPDPTQASTYVSFDFTNVWTIAPDDMPTLLHAP